MKKELVKFGGACLLGAMLGLGVAVVFENTETRAHAQAAAIGTADARYVGDWTFSSAAVIPNNGNNATYSFRAYDLTGTNYVNINPTNAQISWQIGGTNAAAVSQTNLTIICTNSGAGTVFQRTLQFRNGMLTLCTTP